MTLCSDELYVDIDTGEKDVLQFRDKLAAMEVAFQRWSTGGRGGHFHVGIEPMEGTTIHKAQREWVRNNVGPSADLSIYTPTGQWRLPLATHRKHPGGVKLLVEERDGNQLTIPPYQAPPPVPIYTLPTDVSAKTFMINLMVQRGAGHRTPHIYILACNAHELGLSLDKAVDRVLWWNRRYSTPPHPAAYVAAKVSEVYRQREGG